MIVVMHEGMVAERGSHSALLAIEVRIGFRV
jgi:ABC-type transport system involved in Fe-S cluster assembly fused permease/ATPase subunit